MSKDFSAPLTTKNADHTVIHLSAQTKKFFCEVVERIRKVEDRVVSPTQDEVVRRGCELLMVECEKKAA